MQDAHLDCVLGHCEVGGYSPGDQPSGHKHCFTFHKLTPFHSDVGNHALHLDLEADSRLPEIGPLSVESCVLEERHHARVELLDDVVEVHFGGFLVVVWCFPVSKLRLGILTEDLEVTHADRFWK